MLFSLTKLLRTPDAALPFRTELDLSDMTFGSCRPVAEPVVCRGEVRNTAGVLVLTAQLSTRLHAVCDRCASEFTREVSYPVRAVLVTALENEDEADEWVFVVDPEAADLDEILTTAFVLNMDSKLLCKPDCKGLCFRCGADLNDGPCRCRPEPDPRLAVLGQLLKDK
mgnify:FL=1